MKVITVRQPWAWAIIHGGKSVENRSRNIAGGYRGPIAIHAALKFADDYDLAKSTCDQLVPESEWDHPLHRGAIIGTVDVVEVHLADECWHRDICRLASLHKSDPEQVRQLPDSGAGGLIGKARLCSPWALADHHHITLANPKPLAEPIRARGQLGLWNWEGDL